MISERIFIFLILLKVCHHSVSSATPSPFTGNDTTSATPSPLVGNDTTPCGNFTCFHGSKCKDGLCQCMAGYLGNNCSEDMDECAHGHRVCFYRGHCSNTMGSFRCTCLPGWEDTGHCEIPNAPAGNRSCVEDHYGDWCYDLCLNDSMCTGNAKCIDRGGVNGHGCRCVDGWTGSIPNCKDIDECSTKSYCDHSDNCTNTPGSYFCKCSSGWEGDSCSKDINECSFDICKNNARCINFPGSYNCSCAEGWEGTNCTDDINECTQSICNKNSNCTNLMGSFICTCPERWTGKTCDTYDYCASFPCNNSGTCINKNNYFECTCTTGWNGNSCNLDVDECLHSQCTNSGQCINSPGSFKCNCTSGWEGELCEKDVNECDQQPCNSTSSCKNTSGSFTCVLSQSGGNDNRSKTNVGLVVGAVLGSLVLLASLVVAVLIARHKWIHRKVNGATEKDNDDAPENVSQGPGNPKLKLN